MEGGREGGEEGREGGEEGRGGGEGGRKKYIRALAVYNYCLAIPG